MSTFKEKKMKDKVLYGLKSDFILVKKMEFCLFYEWKKKNFLIIKG